MAARRIPTKVVIDALCDPARGYRYHGETVRVRFFRRGTENPRPIPKSASLFEDTARSILKQCGVAPADIEALLKDAPSV